MISQSGNDGHLPMTPVSYSHQPPTESRITMGKSLTEEAQTVAAAFVAARRAAKSLKDYPGVRPTDLEQAYRIQDAAIALDGRSVVGWKVGRINAPLDTQLGCDRLSGPVFEDGLVHAGPDGVPAMAMFADGFGAGEAEFLLHVKPGWNGVAPSDDAETRDIVDAVHLGIEVASSPYPGINADGPLVTISDFGNNLGIVVGPELFGWRDLDLCAIPVTTRVDGAPVGEATAASMLDGPYGAVRFLLKNLTARGFDLSAGLWVSTGAVTGVHTVVPGQKVTAHFGDYGSVACTTVAAKGR